MVLCTKQVTKKSRGLANACEVLHVGREKFYKVCNWNAKGSQSAHM